MNSMRMRSTAILAGIFLISVTTFALAADEDFVPSGFLGENYSRLQEIKMSSGQEARLWISPELSPGRFNSVFLQPNVYFPGPKADEQPSPLILDEIGTYFIDAVRRELADPLQLVSTPGPKTLRFNSAITAATREYISLKPYQFLPFAFFISGVVGDKKGAFLAIEYELLDAASGEIVAIGMVEAIGLKLKNPRDKLTLDLLRPLIDLWAREIGAVIKKVTLGK